MAGLLRPSPGSRTQAFTSTHRAVDYGWGNGATVAAAGSGRVDVQWSSDYGWTVSIDHGYLIDAKTTVTRYRHLSSSGLPADGVFVRAGQPIALQGATGAFALRNGIPQRHLHFELLLGGVRVNPEQFYTSTAGIGATANEGDDMPTAQEIALAVWSWPMARADNSGADGAGDILRFMGARVYGLVEQVAAVRADIDYIHQKSPASLLAIFNKIAVDEPDIEMSAEQLQALSSSLLSVLAPQIVAALTPILEANGAPADLIVGQTIAALAPQFAIVNENIDAVAPEVILEQKKPGN